jgi:hypothetical protein
VLVCLSSLRVKVLMMSRESGDDMIIKQGRSPPPPPAKNSGVGIQTSLHDQ